MPSHRISFVWRGAAQFGSVWGVSDVTQILTAIEQGEANAADKLLPLVYEELRKLAAHRMANEATGQTLQATALVHEAWMSFGGKGKPKIRQPGSFLRRRGRGDASHPD